MRIAISLLFFFFSSQVMAQSKQFVEFIGWTEKKIEIQTISNRTKQSSCTFLVSSDSIRAFVLTGQELKLMRQFGVARKAHERLLGGFMRDSSVYMFAEQAERGVLHCTAFNVITEEKKESFIRLDLSRQATVTYISAGNHFIYITANYRTKELSVYNFISEQPGVGMRFQFNNAFWRDLITGYWARSIHLEALDPETDLNLDALARNNKLYVNNDTLLLVMNNHIDSTFITSFDLKELKAESWLIEHNPGKPAAKRGTVYSDNSFLFRNKLYYVRATNDSLQVQVVDPYTGEINKTFSTERSDDISYKNTPFTEERTVDDRKKEPKDLSKTRSLLRKMVSGNAVIMARPYGSDQIEVVIGSYEKTTTTTVIGGYPGFNSTRPYGYPPTMMYAPSTSRRLIRNSWTNSVHFKMLLNAANFSHIQGEPGSSASERIERYTSKMKLDPGSESQFTTYGQHYYAYYDKAAYKLVVLKF